MVGIVGVWKLQMIKGGIKCGIKKPIEMLVKNKIYKKERRVVDMNVVGTALDELYRIFHILNHDKFDDCLSEPVITIQKTKGITYGYFTLDKVWRNKENTDKNDGLAAKVEEENAFYEINIDPRWFCNRSAADITETLLHEMVHYFNKVNEVKDCSGNMHNKKFKATAESVGLIVARGKSVGWGITSMTDELKEYVDTEIQPKESVFEYFRVGVIKKDSKKKKRTKSFFKYECPKCGTVAKAKKDIKIICGECNCFMDIEDTEKDLEDDIDLDSEKG